MTDSVPHEHLVNHGRCRRYQIHAVFTFETFLHDVQVQQAKKAATKTEPKCLRCFGLIAQRGVIELQFLEGITQCLVFVWPLQDTRPANTCGLISLKPGSASWAAGRDAFVSVSPTRAASSSLIPSDHEPDFAGRKTGARRGARGKHADLFTLVTALGGHQENLVLRLEDAVNDAHQHNYADIIVEPGINDECLERFVD